MNSMHNQPEREASVENPETGLASLIEMPRVRITEETHDGYYVEFGDRQVYIEKSDASTYRLGGAIALGGGAMNMVAGDRITQDKAVPQEFLEVMMLHELREIEYKTAGLADAHNRAVNDEILYALKHFTPEAADRYIAFAKEYRKASASREEEKVREKELRLAEAQRMKAIRVMQIRQGQGARLIISGLMRVSAEDSPEMLYRFDSKKALYVRVDDPSIRIEESRDGFVLDEKMHEMFGGNYMLIVPSELADREFFNSNHYGAHDIQQDNSLHRQFGDWDYKGMMSFCVKLLSRRPRRLPPICPQE